MEEPIFVFEDCASVFAGFFPIRNESKRRACLGHGAFSDWLGQQEMGFAQF